jgi:hypothetical protein
MAAKRTAVPPRVFTDQELEQVARDIVARAPGLSGSDFKQELSSDYKKSDKRVIEAANQLAAHRELYRWSSAKKVRFFARDPFDALAQSVAHALAEGPLSETAIRLRVESSHRGYGDLLKEWLKGALARGDLFVHPPAKGSKLKRFGVSPDVGGMLKTVLVALRKVLATPAGKCVRKEQLLDAIGVALEAASPRGLETKASERELFLVRLCALALDSKPGALLPIRELRARLPFDKQQFDHMALELMRDELVILHHHDFPESLSDPDRAELVVDTCGNHFVGIALRRAP